MRTWAKGKPYFYFVRGKTNIFSLQETHSSAEDAVFWSTQLGDKAYISYGPSKPAGVAILFKNWQGQIVSYEADEHGHWLTLILAFDKVKFILVNIYGYNNEKQNRDLLELALHLDNLKLSFSPNVIIGGDFNLVQG